MTLTWVSAPLKTRLTICSDNIAAPNQCLFCTNSWHLNKHHSAKSGDKYRYKCSFKNCPSSLVLTNFPFSTIPTFSKTDFIQAYHYNQIKNKVISLEHCGTKYYFKTTNDSEITNLTKAICREHLKKKRWMRLRFFWPAKKTPK